MDVFLQIRHGSSLILRNVNWTITKEELPSPILGRTVLKSLGCDNLDMLTAARDRYGGYICMAEHLRKGGNDEESDEMIAILFKEFVIHSDGQVGGWWSAEWWHVCWPERWQYRVYLERAWGTCIWIGGKWLVKEGTNQIEGSHYRK